MLSTIATEKAFKAVVQEPSEWRKQLITKEDPNHVHKTLGVLALCSFVWRIALSGEKDLGFPTYPHLTLPTLFLHLMLSASSFIFHIPAKRITSGYRIWPEYRLHSLIFTCRSLAFIGMYWFETKFGLEEDHLRDLVLILATMFAAEVASASQGPYRSGFSRNLDVSALIKYFFSQAQFSATAMCLVGQRRYTMQFMMILIVQVNAFLMTMRRKNLASQNFLIAIYGFTLACGGLFAGPEFKRGSAANNGGDGHNALRAVAFITNVVSLLRTGPRVPVIRILQDNKFLLWICMYVLMEIVIRQHWDEPITPAGRCAVLSSFVAVFFNGWHKNQQEKLATETARKV